MMSEIASWWGDVLETFGMAAQWKHPGQAPISLRVVVDETADGVESTKHGHERERLLSVAARRAAVGQVQVGDTIIFSSGPYNGTWYVLGVTSQDEAAVVVLARRATRQTAAAPGVREVVR